MAESVIELLTDQISELTIRLDESDSLREAYKAAFLGNPSIFQVEQIMSDLHITGCVISEGWDKLDQATKLLFLSDIVHVNSLG